ncbi:MAG: sulfatase-like hydrolase/transferase [Planctomycetota bacterium]|nr:sulfatase-like hydrolase/transferase [Planctomycetota bacterium]
MKSARRLSFLGHLLLAASVLGVVAESRPAAPGGPVVNAVQVGARTRVSPRRLPQPGEFNVLVVVLDDLGTDKLGIYAADGGPPVACSSPQVSAIPTPNLDALRSDGVLFTRCYANPTCSPTRAALLTGRYGMRTGMGHAVNPSDDPGYRLPTSETMVAELIRDVNTFPYRRGAFGKWHLADYEADDCHPAECGFERFDGLMGNPTSHYDWRKVTALGGTALGCGSSSSAQVPAVPGLPPSTDSWDAAVTRADALAWIQGLSSSERFFAYVAFSPPHAPFEVPPYSTLSRRTAARLSFLGYEAGDTARSGEADDERLIYHSNIEALDHEVGELLAGIPASVLAQTVVLVVGDNGTVGTMISDPALVGHGKRTLYELGTRVPLIVQGPIAPAGGTCRSLVGLVDLWRTIAELTGLRSADIDAAMGGTAVDAESFLDGITRPTSTLARATAYSEAFPNGAPPPASASYLRGITDGAYRYMRIYSDAGVMSERLYHLPSDPCESLDLLAAPHLLTGPESAALALLRVAMDAI